MAATTTAVNGCNVVVSLDNQADSLTDISGSSNKVSMTFNKNIGEFKPFGSEYPVRLSCGRDVEVNLDFVWTAADGEARQLVEQWFFDTDESRDMQIDIPDSSPGSRRYTGPVIIESYPVEAVSDDANPIMISTALKGAGEWTVSTIV